MPSNVNACPQSKGENAEEAKANFVFDHKRILQTTLFSWNYFLSLALKRHLANQKRFNRRSSWQTRRQQSKQS